MAINIHHLNKSMRLKKSVKVQVYLR